MIKKITLTLIICFFMVSCGKKGDPVYKATKQKAKVQSFLINIA